MGKFSELRGILRTTISHINTMKIISFRKQWDFQELPLESRIISGITLLVTGLLGIFGNILVLIIIMRILRHRKNIPNILIYVLAIVDLLNIPFAFTQAVISHFSGGYVGGQPACDFHATMIIFFSYVSVFLVAAMSLDRNLALSQPFCYQRNSYYNSFKMKLFVLTICIISCVLSILPTTGLGRNVLQFPGSYCHFDMDRKKSVTMGLLSLNITVLGILIIFVVVCNVGVCILAWKMIDIRQVLTQKNIANQETSSTTSSGSKGEIIFVRLSIVIMVAFLICWLPAFVSILISK